MQHTSSRGRHRSPLAPAQHNAQFAGAQIHARRQHARCSPAQACSQQSDDISRRVALTKIGLLAAAAAYGGMPMVVMPAHAASPALPFPGQQPAFTALQQQLFSTGSANVSNPGVAWAIGNAGKQLLYPAWLQGTWKVQAHFAGVTFPLGQRYMSKAVPGVLKASAIMALADVGAAMDRPVQYSARFTSNSSEGGVAADRPYNIKQQVDAMLGYEAVTDVSYAAQDNPTRLAVVYQTPRRDTRDIAADVRKAEVFINNRGSAAQTDADGTEHFIGWENYRQVNQAQRQGAVYDYLVANEYTWRPTNASQVQVRQRVAAFLQPQDPFFFNVNNQAVALYDYSYDWVATSSTAQ